MAQHGVKAEPANNTAVPVVSTIFDASAQFLGEMKTWLEENPPSLPITSVVGYKKPSNNYAQVTRAAAQVLSAGVAANVSFDTKIADGLSAVNLTADATKITLADTGFYLFFVSIFGAGMSGTGNTRGVLNRYNSSAVLQETLADETNGAVNTGVVLASGGVVNIGDYVQVSVTNNATGTSGSITARLAVVKMI